MAAGSAHGGTATPNPSPDFRRAVFSAPDFGYPPVMDETIGIVITITPHPDRNPLHWTMTSAGPHGRMTPEVVVGRAEVLATSVPPLGASHRATTGCRCGVSHFMLEQKRAGG